LYNCLIAGVGLDGKSFFYTNAMQVKQDPASLGTGNFSSRVAEASRSGWFECSCCPTNIARLLPSVPGYMYAQKDDNVYVNLFINSQAELTIKNTAVELIQQNNYPWDGQLTFVVQPKTRTSFKLRIRIPGWAMNQAVPSDLYRFESSSSEKPAVRINGQAVGYEIQNGYAVIDRTWSKSDKLEMDLPMDVKRISANEHLRDDQGRVALQRGPLVYCAEWPDNNGKTSNIILPAETAFTPEFKPELLNGVMVLKARVPAVKVEDEKLSTQEQAFIAIPYYGWANRGKGEMMIWFPEKVKGVDLQTN